MGKIFYSMAGEGRGHATRVRAMVEELRHRHEVHLFAPRAAYDLLRNAYEGTKVQVHKIPGLGFYYESQSLHYLRTIRQSAHFLYTLPRLVRRLEAEIRREHPHLIISDFEPALPRAAQRAGVPHLSLDHQHFLVVNDLSGLPRNLRWQAQWMSWVVRAFRVHPVATVVSSFYFPPVKPHFRDVTQTGVLLRPEILNATPEKRGHLTVYLRRFAGPKILHALQSTGRPCFIYGLGERPDESNLHFRGISESGFLENLATSDALITTAGNQLIGEALYLRKPVFAMPESKNFEQYINAHFLKASGQGDWAPLETVSGAQLHNFLARDEEFTANIIPEKLCGNAQALAVIEKQLQKVCVPESASTRPVRRTANILSRGAGFFRTVVRNRRRLDEMPRFLTYTVTFACNARCIMCDSWKMSEKGDLKLPEISHILDQLPVMDVVRLTGGEPFVRRDLLEIAHLVQDKVRPLVLHITTNGFLTDRIVEFCENRRTDMPLQLLVSVDGMAEKHNHVRGNSNAFVSAMKTLQQLATRRKELNLQLAVNQTIVDADGVEHYKLLREHLRPLGIRNQMVMAYDTSATYNLERDIEVAPTQIGEFSTFGEFSQAHLEELLAEVERDTLQFPLLERWAKQYYLRGIRNRLLHGKGEPNPPCVALNSHLRIFPNGDVPTCQFNSKVAGNLREQSFDALWKSARAQKQRDWVRKCPGCWAECEVLPSAIYTGELFLPQVTLSDKSVSTTQSNTFDVMHK